MLNHGVRGGVDTQDTPETPLRAARRQIKLSAESVAALAGITPLTVRRLERGLHVPRPETKGALSAALGVPVEVLWPSHADGPTSGDTQGGVVDA